MSASPFRDKGVLGNRLRTLLRWLRRTRLEVLTRGKFRARDNFSIGKGADVRPPNFFHAGKNVGIGKNLTVETDVIIGDDVLVSSNVSFIGNDHRFDDPHTTVYFQGRYPEQAVVLAGDNLIGFGAVLYGGVTVGRGTIVGASSVVTRDLPEYTVCAGVPARVLRQRFPSEGSSSGGQQRAATRA